MNNTGTTGGYAPVGGSLPKIEKPVNQVHGELISVQTLANDLTMIVETLERRLQSVSRQGLPDAPNQKMPEAPEPVLVPLANELRGVRKTLNSNINRLRELNGSIELPE